MTDQELDRLLRRALLDAADQEAQTPPETETPLSEGHRRRMREMLRDPLLWFRLRNPYPWRTVARRAAVVLLMLSLSAAMVLAVAPKPGRISSAGPCSRMAAGWSSAITATAPPRLCPNTGSPPCRRAIRKRSGRHRMPQEM